MIIPPKGYTAIRLPLRLIERDFWSARHTVTFALWAQLSYAYFIVVCVFGMIWMDISSRERTEVKQIYKSFMRIPNSIKKSVLHLPKNTELNYISGNAYFSNRN